MTPFRRLAGATLDWDYDVKEVPVYLTMQDDTALRIDKCIGKLDLDLRTAVYLFYQKSYNIPMITSKSKSA